MKILWLGRPSDMTAIQAQLDAAFGKMARVLSLGYVIIQCLGEPFARRLMAGAVRTIVDHVSTPKAYKFSKDAAVITIRHDGKRWTFVSASRTKCFAGQSIGGVTTTYPESARAEVTAEILRREAVRFE